MPTEQGHQWDTVEQKLPKILLGLQAVPSNLIESIQSAYHYIFSTEFNFNSISLHLIWIADFFCFLFLRKTCCTWICNSPGRAMWEHILNAFLHFLEIIRLWLSNHGLWFNYFSLSDLQSARTWETYSFKDSTKKLFKNSIFCKHFYKPFWKKSLAHPLCYRKNKFYCSPKKQHYFSEIKFQVPFRGRSSILKCRRGFPYFCVHFSYFNKTSPLILH